MKKNLFRFDDAYEQVYKYSEEHEAYLYWGSYVEHAIKVSDSEYVKERKANDE